MQSHRLAEINSQKDGDSWDGEKNLRLCTYHDFNLQHDGTGQLNEPEACIRWNSVAHLQSGRINPFSLPTLNPCTIHLPKSCLFRLHSKM